MVCVCPATPQPFIGPWTPNLAGTWGISMEKNSENNVFESVLQGAKLQKSLGFPFGFPFGKPPLKSGYTGFIGTSALFLGVPESRKTSNFAPWFCHEDLVKVNSSLTETVLICTVVLLLLCLGQLIMPSSADCKVMENHIMVIIMHGYNIVADCSCRGSDMDLETFSKGIVGRCSLKLQVMQKPRLIWFHSIHLWYSRESQF